MTIILRLIGLVLASCGWLVLALGALFGVWFAWNFKDWALKPHHHGDAHWGVVACLFYAAPTLVLLSAGGLLVLVGHIL
jgi:hypothetical protein